MIVGAVGLPCSGGCDCQFPIFGAVRIDINVNTSLLSPPVALRPHFTYASGSQPLPRYTIRRGVGLGGFGEVYFAISEAGKEVALKRIQRNLEVELRGMSHCLNLKHPNLIDLYDICRDVHDQPWVIMEYVAGPSLRERLDGQPEGLPEAEVRRLFAGIAAGVAYLHAAGVVHRDVKPGNIFDDGGIVKVGDYGLSKFISCSQRGGHTQSVGTVHYMAPEVGRGQYGREIDIYAMGVVLFELLTGRVPFDGESSQEIIMKHLTAIPDLSDVPASYRNVIAWALQKRPDRRPATVAELVQPLGIEIDSYGMARLVDLPTTPLPPPASQVERAADVQHEASATATWQVRRDEEPLARAVRRTLIDFAQWWKSLEAYPGTRLAITIIAIAFLLLNTGWLMPLLICAAFVYVPYYVVRQMVLGVIRQPSYAEAYKLSVARQTAPIPLTAAQWRQQKRIGLASKSSWERLSELSGSLTSATVATFLLTFAVAAIGLRDTELLATAMAPYAMLAITVLVGAWLLLGLGKLWERGNSDAVSRRVVLAGVGALIGCLAYALQGFLFLDQSAATEGSHLIERLPRNFYANNGTPYALTMMAHFALLLGLVGWWKNTDPVRKKRVSVWAIVVAVIVQWGIGQFLPLPQPWGLLIAGGLAVVVQLAAPWENPQQRFRTVPGE